MARELTEKEILSEEGAKLVSRYGPRSKTKDISYRRAVEVVNNWFDKTMELSVKRFTEAIKFPDIQKIKGRVEVKFPNTQKVKGRVEVKFPKVQKIFGTVIAKINFPIVQKITGTVKALVDFPEIQKISGNVKVNFPETQRIKGDVTTDIPKVNLGKISVVPIVIFDGKRIITSFGGGGSKGENTAQAINRLIAILSTDTVSNTPHGSKSGIGTDAVGITGVDIPVKRGVQIKASNANTANIYVGTIDTITAGTADDKDGFELGAGEGILVLVDNVNKIKLISTTSEQKVFWILA